jgi:hypothetical protein
MFLCAKVNLLIKSKPMLKNAFFIAAFSLCVTSAFAQDITTDFRPNVANYSPNTAAFLKYSDRPVSKYTGIPSVSIPIYTIQDGSFSLPIDLSYHGGGIKVEEDASWVGLGWNLNYGGQISRVVRGGEEDFSTTGNGFYKTSVPFKDPAALNAETITWPAAAMAPAFVAINGTTEQYACAQGQSFQLRPPNAFESPYGIDGEPDIFNFQAGQYSGKFIIDRPQCAGETYHIRVLSPENRLKITLVTPGNTFTILTPDGILYEYAVKDLQDDIPTDNTELIGKRLYDQGFNYLPNLQKEYTTTWNLSKITLPNGRIINYAYTSEQLVEISRNQTLTMLTQLATFDVSTPEPSQDFRGTQSPFTIIKSITTQNILSSITFGGLVLNFNIANDRVDVKSNTSTAASRLTGVDVSYNSKYVKGIRLTQDYFNSDAIGKDLYAKRLRLDRVAQTDGTTTLPPYIFSYQSTIEGIATGLPDKDSFNQDYWGYFNGKANDNSPVIFLAPRLPDFYINYTGSPYLGYQGNYEFKFSDRTVDERYAKLGTLNEIDYPTGGVEKFVYESNDFDNVPSVISTNVIGYSNLIGPPVGYSSVPGPPPEVTYNNITGGGIRIQKILSYDCISGQVKERRFEYKGDDGKSSGKLMFPFVFYSTDEIAYHFTPLANSGASPCTVCPGDGFKVTTMLSSNSNYNLGNSAQGSPIGYSDVKEYVNNNLFEEDVFENVMEQQYSSFYWGGTYSSQWPQGLIAHYIPTEYGYQTQHSGADAYTNNSALEVVFTHSGIPNVCHYANGNLLEQFIYKTINNVPVIARETINGYNETQLSYTEGLVEKPYDPDAGLGSPAYSDEAFFYQIPIITNLLNVKVENDYQDDGSVVSKTTNYTFNPDNQIATATATNSKGQTELTNTFYPGDVVRNYSNFPNQSLTVNAQMYGLNQISNPVLEQSFVNSTPVKSTELFYQPVPVAPGNSTSSNYKPYTAKQYTGSTLAEELDYQYDYMGNVTDVKRTGGPPSSFLWGYQKLYPTASVANAVSTDIAYTSFEDASDYGGWTLGSGSVILPNSGVTGTNALNGSVSRTVNAAETYVVSLWSAAGNAVAVNGLAPTLEFSKGSYGMYMATVSGASTISVAGTNVDEVRSYPKGAQMSTFTFDPYIGMRYQADVNNKLSFYNYDTFNRLSTVLDQDQHIVKQNQYNYSTATPCEIYVNDGYTANVTPQCTTGSAPQETVSVPDGYNYSLISQADANSQNPTTAQNMANAAATCVPSIPINYIQKGTGTNITIGFTVPTGATNLTVSWIDITDHLNNGSVPVSTTTPTVTLQGTGVTYNISVTANYDGTTIIGGRGFTFEAYENVQISQVFLPTGCNGDCGVTYTVPAGAYTSGVSQAAADQLAQNDMDANGQAYANTH